MIYTAIATPILRKKLKGFDVILAHSQPSNWLAFQVKKQEGIPYVSYLHQANRFHYPRSIDKKTGWSTDPNMVLLNKIHGLAKIIPSLDRLSITEADHLLVNSRWIKEKVERHYGREAEVCYPGVNPEKFCKAKYIREDEGEPFILSTNRHYPQKCLQILLKVLSKIVEHYPDIKCYMTGAHTNYTNRLKEYAKKLDISENINFTNKLGEKDLLHHYQNAYIYTYTSPEEDLGLGPIEAGACGVPSVVWDHAGPRETVINGKTGYRIKPFDLEEMSEKHLKLIEEPDLRKELGVNASEYVRKTFSWENHVDLIEDLLESL
jgi:glycosyltransferase involved in cell wall biosynthesis